MGLLNTVPRDLYDDLQRRYDKLFDAYAALRPTHSPVAPMRLVPAREPSELQALHAVERVVVEPRVAAIADNLLQQHPELTRMAAMAEAKRLDDIARGRTVAPALGKAS